MSGRIALRRLPKEPTGGCVLLLLLLHNGVLLLLLLLQECTLLLLLLLDGLLHEWLLLLLRRNRRDHLPADLRTRRRHLKHEWVRRACWLVLLLLLSTLIDDAASSITVLVHVNLRTTAEQLLLQAAQTRAALRLLRELKLHSNRS